MNSMKRMLLLESIGVMRVVATSSSGTACWGDDVETFPHWTNSDARLGRKWFSVDSE